MKETISHNLIVLAGALIAVMAIVVTIRIFKLSKKTNTAKTMALAGISALCSFHLVVFSIHHVGEAFLSENIVNLTISESLEVLASIILAFTIYAFDQTTRKYFK